MYVVVPHCSFNLHFLNCPLRNISFCFMNLKLIIIRYENILLGMKI